jgi:hypothetical protein
MSQETHRPARCYRDGNCEIIEGEETVTEAARRGPSEKGPRESPTTDQLAGVYVEIAGPEKVHVPPRPPVPPETPDVP